MSDITPIYIPPHRNLVRGLRVIRKLGIRLRCIKLPYDHTNSVIYDKDEAINCYTDEFLMALTSAGRIHLAGMITSSSVAPYNPYVTQDDYERFVRERNQEVDLARRSGWRGIPEPVRGPCGHLEKPDSGYIEDTKPLGSAGSRLIVEQAKRASPQKPLILVLCGPLTVAAEAYLLDSTIADNVIVLSLAGDRDHPIGFNQWSDGWSFYIVLQKLRMMIFPSWGAAPHVEKARLVELPDTPIRQWMIDKRHPNGWPSSWDLDCPPAISLVRRDYVLQMKPIAFSHWVTDAVGHCQAHELPVYKVVPHSGSYYISRVNSEVATEAWWQALSDQAAYHPEAAG